MESKYKKSSSELFTFRLAQQVNKMQHELHQHRNYLEQNVALRTVHLMRRIEVLEACNAALCNKLIFSQEVLENCTSRLAETAESTSRMRLVRTVSAADPRLRKAP